jgi:hypothetical protein
MQITPQHVEEYRTLQQEILGSLMDFSVAEKELYDLVAVLDAISRHYKISGSIEDPNNVPHGK